jgi:hypothetical protein
MDWPYVFSSAVGAGFGGMVTAFATWMRTGKQVEIAVATIRTEISRIDKERLVERAVHDVHEATMVKHHENQNIHMSDAWRDEMRSRLKRIEELQDSMLKRLLEGA